jgi:LuxR family transcriptional regulator, maltose regulon positive regulatory protein
MPQTGMPFVRDNLLLLTNRRPILVGTQAWFRWLAQATRFCYQPLSTFHRLTLRKEKRGHQYYWYAYLKNDRKLHNAYAGRTELLTSERLQQVFAHIMTKMTRQGKEV